MRIYIEEAFLEHFLKLSNDSSFGVRTLWNFVNNYAQITWYFNATVSSENFSNWEFSNRFLAAITGKSHIKKTVSDFRLEINKKTSEIQILFADTHEDWHIDLKEEILIFTVANFEKEMENIAAKLDFYFDADNISNWSGLTSLSVAPFRSVTLIDKYIFALYIKYNDESILENGFIKLLQKLNLRENQLLNVYTSIPSASGSFSNFRNQLEDIYALTSDELASGFDFKVYYTEKDKSFDFHDRNLMTNYCIVKIGTGFKSSFKKFTNTELEGYSIFQKKGYDMIRYRQKMLAEYQKPFRRDELIIFEN